MSNFWSEKEQANLFLKFMPPLKQKLYREVAKIIELNKITRILDFGCGNGNQIGFLKDEVEICLYDINKSAAKEAFATYANLKNVSLIENLETERINHFDAVVVNMVWMCLSTESEVDQFFKQIISAKSVNGTIILSMTHPCFRSELFSYYYTSFKDSKKLFDYTKEGDSFEVTIKDKSHTAFTDYHYSLTFFFNKLKQFNLQLVEFIELSDEEFNLSVNKRFTPYILTVLK